MTRKAGTGEWPDAHISLALRSHATPLIIPQAAQGFLAITGEQYMRLHLCLLAVSFQSLLQAGDACYDQHPTRIPYRT